MTLPTAIAGHVHDEPRLEAAGCPRCGLDDRGGGEALACPRCTTIGAGRYCSKCGSELERGHPVRRAMRALFSPFFDYFEHSRWLIRPGELAHEVRSGHFTGVELLGFWVAAVLVTGLVEAFLPIVQGEKFELPILLEAAQALLLMVRAIIVLAPAHLLLRIGHRDVSFREYLLTTLAVAALLYPWITIAQKLMADRLPGGSMPWTMPFSVTFYAAAYAALYRRRIWTALPIFAGYVLSLLALLAGIALLVAHARQAQPAAKAPATAARKP